jgi:predicted DNA binding CopG/RHH family protein
MKYYELDKEEQDLLDSFERGEFKSVKNLAIVMKEHQSYARATVSRSKNINIRISERDLQKLKAKAIEKGLPYQTLVASILHQYGSEA